MKPENLFFETSGLDQDHAQRLTEEALKGADDGELFMEHTLSESFSFDNNTVVSGSRLKLHNPGQTIWPLRK